MTELNLKDAYNLIWEDHFDNGPEAFYAVPEMLLKRLEAAIPDETSLYDAILADEGQDFRPLW